MRRSSQNTSSAMADANPAASRVLTSATPDFALASNRNAVHWNWCHQGMNSRANKWFLEQELKSGRRCPCNLVPGNMPFVRLSWLLNPDNCLRDLPRLQEMPANALVFPCEMSQAYFVTHRWLEVDHPDRTGEQLAVALSAMWVESDPESVADWRTVSRVHQTGVWYDYMCVPQPPQRREEQITLDRWLRHVLLLPRVTTLIAVASGEKLFTNRAWCVAEAALAQTVDDNWKLVSLSRQRSRYQDFFDGDRDLLTRKESRRGYLAGVLKLEQWIKETSYLEDTSSEKFSDEIRTHGEFVKKVARANLEVAFPKQNEPLTAKELLALANDLGLETTVPADLLLCMEALQQCHIEKGA